MERHDSGTRARNRGKRRRLSSTRSERHRHPAYVDTPLAGQGDRAWHRRQINTLTAAFRAAGAPVNLRHDRRPHADFDGFLVTAALAARIKRTGKLVVALPAAPSMTTWWSSRLTS